VAGETARVLAERLADAAATPWEPDVPQPWCWADHQSAIRAVGEAAGGEAEERLAEALVAVCLSQFCAGRPPLAAETFAWMLARAPRAVEDALSAPMVAGGGGSEIWSYAGRIPGEEGARWLLRLFAIDDREATDVVRWGSASWTPADWILRLDALADARIVPRPSLFDWVYGLLEPPREASSAQVRVALAYCDTPADSTLRTVCRTIRGFRTGQPAHDLDLFWWGAGEAEPELLRWILELAGEPGQREPLVAAARAAGLVDERTAAFLAAPLERPAWVDGEVPWELAEVVEPGSVHVAADGRLGAGDLADSLGPDGPPVVLLVAPGRHRVRVAIAAHPLAGRECAAAEVLIDPAAEVARWAPVTGRFGLPGYQSPTQDGAFGPPAAFGDVPEKLVAEDLPGGPRGRCLTAVGLVIHTIGGEQHQLCRLWTGHDAGGAVVRVFADLGLLEYDPAASRLPW
jgi:hypothetical protein